MKEYAVYLKGTIDNDEMDWFDRYNTAFETAQEMANSLPEGESLLLSEVEGGDFEDSPLEFRKVDGIVCQFKDGAHLFI